jgi:hypothetical protein
MTFAGVLVAGLVFAREGHSPFPDALPAVIGTGGIIALLCGREHSGGPVRDVLEHRAAVGIGKLSYSLYLWHWPVFVVFVWTAGLRSAATRLAALALVAALSVCSYLLVERPFRYGAVFRRAPRLAVIGTMLVAVAVGARVYTGIDHRHLSLALSTVDRHIDDWYPTNYWPGVQLTGCPPSQTRGLGGLGLITYSRSGCRRPPAAGRIFVLGDSHALAYSAMLRQLAATGAYDIYMYYWSSCGLLTLRGGGAYANPACARFADLVLHDVARRAGPHDVVFLAALRVPRLTLQNGPTDLRAVEQAIFSPAAAQLRHRAEDAAVSALRPVARTGARIVFEDPTPMFPAPAFRCVDWFNRHNPVCAPGLTIPRAMFERLRAPTLGAYERIERELPRVSTWDPLPVLCPGSICASMRGSMPLVIDGDHLSTYSNRLLTPDFERYLSRLYRR